VSAELETVDLKAIAEYMDLVAKGRRDQVQSVRIRLEKG